MNNTENQTAYDIGREYSYRLQKMVEGYEYLSGKPIQADDYEFWNQKEVEKVETLASLWWNIGKINDPFFHEEI